MKRIPFKRGDKIEFDGNPATVVCDNGGDLIRVETKDGSFHDWFFEVGGGECKLVEEEDDSSNADIEAEVCNDIMDRQQRGIKKYGMTLAQNDAELKERLNHIYEELLDAALYIKWSMRKLV